jgi:hypothetical protein
MNHRIVLVALVASISAAWTPSASADPAPTATASERPYRGSLRGFLAPGASDLGVSVRLGVQGETWLDDTFGVGGRFAWGEDAGIFVGPFRRAYTLEPQFAVRTGWTHFQLALAAGAGAGVATVGDDEHCVFGGGCSIHVSHDDAIAIASLEANLLGYAGPVALSLGGRAETTTLGGASYLAVAGVGWAIR